MKPRSVFFGFALSLGIAAVPVLAQEPFIRGDCNGDGELDISDPITGLSYLFVGVEVRCADFCDANDDGDVDISDPIYILTHLFGDGPHPPTPFPGLGYDPTPDAMPCGEAVDDIEIYYPDKVSMTGEESVEIAGMIASEQDIRKAFAVVNGMPYTIPLDEEMKFEIVVPLATEGDDPVAIENEIVIQAAALGGSVVAEEVLTVVYAREYEQKAVIVGFQKDTAIQQIEELNAGIGAEIRDRIGVDMYLLDLAEGMSVEEAIDYYNGKTEVLFGEPNYLRVNPAQAIPNDPLYPQQRSLGFPFQWQWSVWLRGVPQWQLAWQVMKGSTAVVVAVIDSGIDYTHPDLVDNLWVNQGELPVGLVATGDVDGDGFVTLRDANLPAGGPIFAGFSVVDTNANGIIDGADLLANLSDAQDNDSNGFVDDLIGWNFGTLPGNNPMDRVTPVCQGHGTCVAGLIGASGNNNTGVCGTNWRVSIMPLRVQMTATGQFSTAAVTQAMNYARRMGAQIANCSFDFTMPQVPQQWSNPQGTGAYQLADAAGMFIACAAGDRGVNNDVVMNWPGNLSLTLGGLVQVNSSNRAGNFATVAAGDGYDTNWGPTTVNLSAPGTGDIVFSTRVWGIPTRPNSPIPNIPRVANYGPFAGTSAATAHASGAAALLLSLRPNLVGSAARRILTTRWWGPPVPPPLAPTPGGLDPATAAMLMQSMQPPAVPADIVTTLGAGSNVMPDVRIFNQQLPTGLGFLPFGTPSAPFMGGVEVATGNIDINAGDDIVLATNSAMTPPQVRVTDRSGNVKAQMPVAVPGGIWTLATAALDRDWLDEILILEPVPGTSLYRIAAYQHTPPSLTLFGRSVVSFPAGSTLAAADVNGDGWDEIVVGIAGTAPTTPARVEVYTVSRAPSFLGFPLTRIAVWPVVSSTVPGTFLPTRVDVAVGDLDGNSVADEIIAIPTDGIIVPPSGPTAPLGDVGRVFSASGTLLTTFGNFLRNPLGQRARVDAGDIDNDGVDEVLVGQGPNWLMGLGPSVQVYDWVSALRPGATPVMTSFMPYLPTPPALALSAAIRVAAMR